MGTKADNYISYRAAIRCRGGSCGMRRHLGMHDVATFAVNHSCLILLTWLARVSYGNAARSPTAMLSIATQTVESVSQH